MFFRDFQECFFHCSIQGMSDWTEDVGFGRQRLTGTNPGVITLCQELPKKYVVWSTKHNIYIEMATS